LSQFFDQYFVDVKKGMFLDIKLKSIDKQRLNSQGSNPSGITGRLSKIITTRVNPRIHAGLSFSDYQKLSLFITHFDVKKGVT
jgi:hypothetical protein